MTMLNKSRTNIVADTFVGINWDKQLRFLPIFAVYKAPSDFPGKYVVRLFDGEKPTAMITVCATLEAARMTIDGRRFYNIGRQPGDDPVIVEVWI